MPATDEVGRELGLTGFPHEAAEGQHSLDCWPSALQTSCCLHQQSSCRTGWPLVTTVKEPRGTGRGTWCPLRFKQLMGVRWRGRLVGAAGFVEHPSSTLLWLLSYVVTGISFSAVVGARPPRGGEYVFGSCAGHFV